MSSEKKWFIYLGDHHEGPFDLSELRDKKAGGVVTSSTYVWADGMPDWQLITEVTELKGPILEGATPKPVAVAQPIQPPVETSPEPAPVLAPQQEEIQAAPAVSEANAPVATEEDATTQLSPKEQRKLEKEQARAEKAAAKEAKKAAKQAAKDAKKAERKKKADVEAVGGDSSGVAVRGGERIAPKLIKFLLVVLMFAGGGYAYLEGHLDPVIQHPMVKASLQTAQDFTRPYLRQAIQKYPFLGDFVSPLPAIDDVNELDLGSLKNAAIAPIQKMGPRASIGLSIADPMAPFVYISTNLPDGAVFDVYVVGISHTLLNRFSFAGRMRVQTEKQFGRSAVIQELSKKPIARGEYQIYVLEADQQPQAVKSILDRAKPSSAVLPANFPQGKKIVLKKVYFLGGKRDKYYRERLKLFHEKLVMKGKNEIRELGQFEATLQQQLAQTIQTYQRLSRGRMTRGKQRQWNRFHNKWQGMNRQLSLSFDRWTPDVTATQYYYSKLYDEVRALGLSISQLHDQEHRVFLAGRVSVQDKEQHGVLLGRAQTQLGQLKERMKMIRTRPPLPSGLPDRSGL